jgi:hypothetical protein
MLAIDASLGDLSGTTRRRRCVVTRVTTRLGPSYWPGKYVTPRRTEVKQHSTLPRWLDRRTLIALVAATAVVTTAIYATSTHNSAPTAAQQVANIGPVDAGGSALTLPFDLADLQRKVGQYTATGITDSTDTLQKTSQLIANYQIDVDPNRLQPFLDQGATATTPQQITNFANAFLIQQGVPQATIDQTMASIATLQAQASGGQVQGLEVGGQGQGQGQIDWKKILIAVAVIIAAALAGLLAASGALSTTQTDSKVKCPGSTGTWMGAPLSTDAGRDAVLQRLPIRRADPRAGGLSTTSGIGIDSASNEYIFTVQPDGKVYTFDSSTVDQDLVAATNARLQRIGVNVSGSSVHAEQKMATYMRICHVDTVDFVINNNYICDAAPNACDKVLEYLLAPAQRLTVHYVAASWSKQGDPGVGLPRQGTWISNLYVGK